MLSKLNQTQELLNVFPASPDPKNVEKTNRVSEAAALKGLINNATDYTPTPQTSTPSTPQVNEEEAIQDLEKKLKDIDAIEEQIAKLVPINFYKLWWWFVPVQTLGYQYYKTLIQLFYVAPIEISRVREELAGSQQKIANTLFAEFERYQSSKILPETAGITQMKHQLSEQFKAVFPEQPKPRHWFLAIFRGQVKVKLTPKQKQGQKDVNNGFSELLNNLWNLVKLGRDKQREFAELEENAQSLITILAQAVAEAAYSTESALAPVLRAVFTSDFAGDSFNSKKQEIEQSIQSLIAVYADLPADNSVQDKAASLKTMLQCVSKTLVTINKLPELVKEIEFALAEREKAVKLITQAEVLQQILNKAKSGNKYDANTVSQTIQELFGQHSTTVANKLQPALARILVEVEALLVTYEKLFDDANAKSKADTIEGILSTVSGVFNGLGIHTDSLVQNIDNKIAARELKLRTAKEVADIDNAGKSIVAILQRAPTSNAAINFETTLATELDKVFKVDKHEIVSLSFYARSTVVTAVTALAETYPTLHNPHSNYVASLLKSLQSYFANSGNEYARVVQIISKKLENCDGLLKEYKRVGDSFINLTASAIDSMSKFKEFDVSEKVVKTDAELRVANDAHNMSQLLTQLEREMKDFLPVIFGDNFNDTDSQGELNNIRNNIKDKLTYLSDLYHAKFLDLPRTLVPELRVLFNLAHEKNLINTLDNAQSLQSTYDLQDAISQFKDLLKQIAKAGINDSYKTIMAKADGIVNKLKPVFDSNNPKLIELAKKLISHDLVRVFNDAQENIKRNPDEHLRVRDCCEGLFDILNEQLGDCDKIHQLSEDYDAVKDLRSARMTFLTAKLEELNSALKNFRANLTPNLNDCNQIVNLLKQIDEHKVLYWQQPKLKSIVESIRTALRGIVKNYKQDYILLEADRDMYYLTDTTKSTSFAILNQILKMEGIDVSETSRHQTTSTLHGEIREFDAEIRQRQQRVKEAHQRMVGFRNSIRILEPQELKPTATNINFNVFSESFQCYLKDGRTIDLETLQDTLKPLGANNKFTLDDLRECLDADNVLLGSAATGKENEVIIPNDSLIKGVLIALNFVETTRVSFAGKLPPSTAGKSACVSSAIKDDVDGMKDDLALLIKSCRAAIKDISSSYSIILARAHKNMSGNKPQTEVIETLDKLTSLLARVEDIQNEAVKELSYLQQIRFQAPAPVSAVSLGKGAPTHDYTKPILSIR